jgi:hypothetical protein
MTTRAGKADCDGINVVGARSMSFLHLSYQKRRSTAMGENPCPYGQRYHNHEHDACRMCSVHEADRCPLDRPEVEKR